MMHGDQRRRRRGVWLSIVLMYVALSNAWWAYRSITTYWDLVSHHDPRTPHWPFLAMGILSVLAVGGAVGLWMMRRWGFYLYVACWAAVVVVTMVLRLPLQAYLLSVVSVLLLGFSIWPRRDELL